MQRTIGRAMLEAYNRVALKRKHGRGGWRRGAGRPTTNPHRKVSQWERGEFIALDGEGYNTPDGRHIYALLQASSGEILFDIDGLSTRRIEDFLLKLRYDHPLAIFVIFNGSYDWTKWLTPRGPLEIRAHDVQKMNGGAMEIFPHNMWCAEETRWYDKTENLDPFAAIQLNYIPRKRFRLGYHGVWWDGNPFNGDSHESGFALMETKS